MRCQFCGWDNSPEKTHCEKCGKPLSANERVNQRFSDGHETRRQNTGNVASALKTTVRESEQIFSPAMESNRTVCPNCGYELNNGFCASCGYSARENTPVHQAENANVLNEDVNQVGVKHTIRPQRKSPKEIKFTLTPISEKTGLPEGQPISYKGEETIFLNRSNTDPNNATITSGVQASIQYIQGRWYIEDQSEFKTTFVQASRSVELQVGDLILLGNQLFSFGYSKD